MRISDWSSYVCSSDLGRQQPPGECHVAMAEIGERDADRRPHQGRGQADVVQAAEAHLPCQKRARRLSERRDDEAEGQQAHHLGDAGAPIEVRDGVPAEKQNERSEEHTSELQSLMRTSYAAL